MSALDWPLMRNNITRSDLDALMTYLQADDPRLTQGQQVEALEREWSAWLGVRHSVFVNSGSSANLITLAALRHLKGPGEVIVPPLTWVSDIAAVLHAGLEPVFVDIDRRTLGMDNRQTIEALTDRTRAVFLTHILGYNALSQELLDELARRKVLLIEDVCESHGATFKGRKLGTFGWASNFSFYYAHHMSTIEGGMVCTDDAELYEVLRMLRSHGMVRESKSDAIRRGYAQAHADLNLDFIFAYPAWNVRSTELNAVLGRSQLKQLDANNESRRKNLAAFLDGLDAEKYVTEFSTEGSCNYAFTLVLRRADPEMARKVEAELKRLGVEFRRGTSGGGNQLRQPYLKAILKSVDLARFPNVEHVHFYGWYIGNYPDLEVDKIGVLCEALNAIRCGAKT